MAVTAKWYGNAFKNAFNKLIDWDSDTIKVALCTSSYTPDQDTHEFFDDITNEVAAGGGYSSGGATLTTSAPTYDAGTNTTKLDATDLTWAASTITARYAIIYDATPALAADQPLIAYVDFGEDKSSSSGNFTIQWHSDGVVKAVTE